MHKRSGESYKEGELEVILSLAPTKVNMYWLSLLLERSIDAIELVYKLAFGLGPFGKTADVQERKILEAKERVAIGIGRRRPRKPKT